MKQVNVSFQAPPPARKVKKELHAINTYLDAIVLDFLLFCQQLGAINFSPNQSEEDKVHNFRVGIMPGENRGERLAKKFCTLNYAWRKFCNKDWKYHKINLDAFEKGVAKNIKQLAPGYAAPKVHVVDSREQILNADGTIAGTKAGIKTVTPTIEIVKR